MNRFFFYPFRIDFYIDNEKYHCVIKVNRDILCTSRTNTKKLFLENQIITRNSLVLKFDL